MLTRLLQWLNTIEKQNFGSKQTGSVNAESGQQVAEAPPELTNADLELLFTQLLEGVYQGRGQQWAIKYLQRMEDRISVERWLDWLSLFGEKLLMSPAPNHQLATQMVQLGELNIGKVGELAHEIAIKLLNRDTDRFPEVGKEIQTYTVTITATDDTIVNSPGKELIRNFGELLWESEEPEIATTPENPSSPIANSSTENSASHNWENQGEVIEFSAATEPVTDSSTENSASYNWENQGEVIEFSAATEPVTDSSTENSPSHSWENQGEVIEFSAATEPVTDSSTENSASHSWETQEEEVVTAEAVRLIPTEKDVINNLSELGFDDQRATLGSAIVSAANPESDVANTVDELLVRLEQSASLVQQLANHLSIQNDHLPSITAESLNLLTAQAWFYQGLQQAKAGDLAGAIASYNQSIQFNPNSSEYWFNRGLTLFHLEDLTEAIASYDQAIALKPDYYKALYHRGKTLGELGMFEEAIASFNQAIAIHPEQAEVWSSKGSAELKLGQITAAIASYDQALELEPQNAENWYYRGVAQSIDEQLEQAIASYDRALGIKPDFHEAWIDRGVVLFNLKQWLAAIASWDNALASQPDIYLAWYNRGIALDNLGQREEAIASYQQAIAIQPDFHLAWYNQGVALFYLERYYEAIVAYDNALKIKLDYWEAWIGRGTAAGEIDSDRLNLLTTIAINHPALNQGSYTGKIASYEEGLKHIRPDTHPEGWGRLHLAIGNTDYEQGKKHHTARNYWHKAVGEYNQALLTLTSSDFPQLHLEVLQSLVKALLGLGETTQAQDLQQRGANLLQQLLNEYTRSEDSKKQLALKFAGLGQMAVDIAVEHGDLVEAWEIAEYEKNACLSLLLFGWNADIYPLKYSSVQQILNPHTAIIYWHMSQVALHTFIIKNQAPSPILVFTPIQDIETINPTLLQDIPLPEATRRLIAFENWLEDWQQDYQEYRRLAQDQTSKSNHTWRLQMEQRLRELRNILEIDKIAQELEDITQLILIPHRDLQRLPLHTLFYISGYQEKLGNVEPNYIITYLPSIQTGLSMRTASDWQLSEQPLFSVEYPSNSNYSTLKFANLESEIVSQIFTDSHRLQGEAATKDNVAAALFDYYFNKYNVFHFAGQVINNLHEPSKSELALAGEDKLTLGEICQGNLSSYNLVTLSACDPVISDHQIITTDYVGLVNGFVAGGVPYVVSTLWSVESSASALVIIEFYRRLKLVRSPNLALSEATKWLRELTAAELTQWYEDLLNQLPPEELKIRAFVATQMYRISKMAPEKKLYSHPYYWAAFILTGKPT